MRITLSEPDPAWADDFLVVRRHVVRALGDAALAVEHVGSTSIPGLCAKPIIDVVIVVADADDEAAYADLLRDAGFRFHHREPAWHQHRMFKHVTPAANVHVYSRGCTEVERMLLFRDYLRANAAARDVYAAEKRKLAEQEWGAVQEYADAKTDIVERLIAEARVAEGADA